MTTKKNQIAFKMAIEAYDGKWFITIYAAQVTVPDDVDIFIGQRERDQKYEWMVAHFIKGDEGENLHELVEEGRDWILNAQDYVRKLHESKEEIKDVFNRFRPSQN